MLGATAPNCQRPLSVTKRPCGFMVTSEHKLPLVPAPKKLFGLRRVSTSLGLSVLRSNMASLRGCLYRLVKGCLKRGLATANSASVIAAIITVVVAIIIVASQQGVWGTRKGPSSGTEEFKCQVAPACPSMSLPLTSLWTGKQAAGSQELQRIVVSTPSPEVCKPQCWTQGWGSWVRGSPPPER